ncbi:MAG: MFS transporter [Promethearchaeota archaeon]
MDATANISSFRSYLFFWSGQLISILGSTVVSFCLTWWLTTTTESAIALSIRSISWLIPFVLASLIGGVVADKFDRKKIIFLVDSLQAFSTFILFLFFLYNFMEYWMLYFFGAFRAVCQAFHMPAESAIIPTMVPKNKLSRINSINFLLTGFIHIVGPAIGGTVMIFLTIEQALWIDIITYAIAIIPLLLIKIPSVIKEEESHKPRSFLKELKSGFKSLLAVPGLLILIIEAMLCNFFMQPIGTLLPYYVKVLHNGTVVNYAMISTFFNVGMLIGGIITSVKKKWKHKIPIITLAIFTHGVVYALFSFVPYGFFSLMMLYSAIRGFTMPFINALYFTILQTCVSHDKLGRIVSIDNTLSFVSMPIGSMLAGPLAEVYGVGPLFFVSASLYITTTVTIYFFTNIRHLDSIETVSES